MTAVYKKELKTYFTGIMGYVFIAFILLLIGIYTAVINIRSMSPFFEYVFGNMSFIYLVAIPILSMRVMADERRQKTDQLLYSLPITGWEIVLGKYLSMITVILVPCLVSALYPIVLSFFGGVEFGTAYSTMFSFFLLGASLAAIGLFMSSLTENQLVAAATSFIVILICYLMSGLSYYLSASALTAVLCFAALIVIVAVGVLLVSKSRLLGVIIFALGEIPLIVVYSTNPSLLDGSFQRLLSALSVFDRMDTFINGVFDLKIVLYYLSVIFLFLFFTERTVEKRRWS